MSSTKYLMSMGELKRKDNSLVFQNDSRNFYLPVEGIREIYCMNEISINTKLLEFLSRAGITVHFFNYYGQYSGSFYPKEYLVSGNLTVRQAEAFLNYRMDIAKAIVKGIADNVYEVLYHYYRHGKKEVKDTIDWISINVPKWLEKDIDIKQLLFVEGEIWQRFYSNFKYFLPEHFALNKRVRRPPDNPINAMISFGNSLLYSKTVTQIYNTHLNQTISFLHEPSEGRFSLSLDLCEVFKPAVVYKTIFEVINNKKIQESKHFDKKLNNCLLNEAGKKIFVQALEDRFESVFQHERLRRKVTYRTAIKLDAYKLIKFIMEGKEFKPFNLKEMM